jgi:uncharacterized protein (TIGR01319 family)
MKIDCLVAEIGSTTTVINAFNIHQEPICFLGRGMYRTTVESDVNIGLDEAIKDLERNLNVDHIEYQELFASSSAAGGLKMTVHGLVYDMTAKAAKEAALNAGANIHLITSNHLELEQIEQIKQIKPNIIVVSGGTDHGDKDVSYQNLIKLTSLQIPIIYAGNMTNHERIKKLNVPWVKIVENVYPKVDDFNIIPLRKAIYQTFEENIIHAKGMQNIFEKVNQKIIPTPGAVMDATLLLNQIIEGVMTLDVGGATTDVHSVCETSPAYVKYSDGEPSFKRSVEGDLGVFVSRKTVLDMILEKELHKRLGLTFLDAKTLIDHEPFIPNTEIGTKFIDFLTEKCVHIALDRHIGSLKHVFTTTGVKLIPQGKDLTLVKAIFLTGGALIHAKDPKQIVKSYLETQTSKLAPNPNTAIYLDHDYIFASIGVLSNIYPEAAKVLLKQSLRWE